MKKLSCIALVCLFVFGVSSSARGSSCLFENSLAKVVGPGTIEATIIGGIGGGINLLILKAIDGFGNLVKKSLNGSGPKCPLLPFVRR